MICSTHGLHHLILVLLADAVGCSDPHDLSEVARGIRILFDNHLSPEAEVEDESPWRIAPEIFPPRLGDVLWRMPNINPYSRTSTTNGALG